MRTTMGLRGNGGAASRLARALFFFAVIGVLSAVVARAEVPVKFTYQGNLRQSGFLVNGARSMVFRIYDSSTSPTVLWTSPVFSVQVSTGVFRVTLEPTTLTDWQTGALWLELQVEGNKMSPREELTSSPYAINSLLLSGKRYITADSAPAAVSSGDLWMDTTGGALNYWNGSSWVAASGSSIPGAHAATHAGNGSDPIVSLGTHTVTGALTVQGRINPSSDLLAGGAGYSVTFSSAVHAGWFVGDGSGLDALNASKITSGSLSADRIAPGVLVSTHISAGAIKTANLADAAVTTAKLAQSGCATGQVLQWNGSQWICATPSAGTAESDPLSIHSQETLQQGATFYVSSGTVNTLTVNTRLDVGGTAKMGTGLFDFSGVAGTIGFDAVPAIALSGSALNTFRYNSATGLNFVDRNSGNVAMFAGASGNVGIGTVTPPYRLVVSSGAGEAGVMLAISTGTSTVIRMTGAGEVFANKFFGDGSGLTGVPGSDNLGNHTATKDLNMAGHDIFAVSTMTVSSITTTGAAVTFSTNVYIVGIASAARFYGDGSGLTGIPGTDNLGNHIATKNLNMSGHDIFAVSTMTVSSITTTGAAVTFSTNVYIVGIASAAKFYGDGSALTGVSGSDNLGNHIATQNLNMSGHDIFAVSTMTVSSITTSGAAVTFSTNVYIVGVASATRYYGDGSTLTGIHASDNLGNHIATTTLNMAGHDIFAVSTMTVSSITTTGSAVTFSTNVYIVGIASAAKFYGDGSALTGVSGSDNLGNHIATQNLNMAGHDIFAVSTMTVSSITTTGAAVTFSTNVYIVGIASAAKFYGDGSGLTGIPGTDNLGNHIATQNLNMAGHDIFAISTMTVSSITTTGAAVTFSTNVYIVGIASAAKFYGDGSGLTGIPGTDNLGNHIATQNLNMSGHDIFAVSTMTVSSITTTGAAVTFSTNVYIVGIASAAKFYGDGSGLSNIPGNDNLGNHIATQNLNMSGHDIFAVSTMTVSSITTTGAAVTFSTNVYIVGIASAAKFYGDGSALTGVSGSDNLGNHTATQNLNMSYKDIVNVSSISLGSIITDGTGVSITTNVFVGGRLGIGTLTPTEDLSVTGNVLVSNLSGADNRCVYVDSYGVLRAKGSDCGTAAGAADNLGNHTATQNIRLNGNWLSNDGGNAGIRVDNNGWVGVGTGSPDQALAVIGAISQTGNLISSGTGNNYFAGNIGIGTAVPPYRLVVSSGAGEAGTLLAISTGGVTVIRMTGAGEVFANKFHGDGSALTGVSGSDNLGNHIATTTLNMAGHDISAVSMMTVSSITTTGTAVIFSTNVYIVGVASATRYYGDGSALTGINTSDNLGNHIATTTLNMAGNSIVNAASGTFSAAVTLNGSTLTVTGRDAAGYSLLLSSGISMPAGTVTANLFSGSGAGLTGLNADNLAAGTVVDNRLSSNVDLLNAGQNLTGVKTFVSSVTVTDALGIGAGRIHYAAGVEMSSASAAQYGGVYVSTHIYTPGNIYAGKLYGDGSALSGIIAADNLGNHIATTTLNMAGNSIVNAASGTFSAAVTLNGSTLTVTGRDAAGYSLLLSSGISTPAGTVTANLFSGSGAGLTGLNADNLAAGTVTDNRLSANVDLLNAGQNLTGVKTFVSSVTVTDALGIGAGRVHYAAGVDVSSSSAAQYGGVYVSTHIYTPGNIYAAKFYGDGSGLSGANDNLGNHIATTTLNMAGNSIVNAASGTFSAAVTLNGSTLTVTGRDAAGYSLLLSSGISMPAGTVTANLFSGSGAGLTGLNADNLSTGTVTDARLSANVDLLNASQNLTGVKTFVSSITVMDALGIGASQVRYNAGVEMSSASAVQYGGVYVSTHIYTPGTVYAANVYANKLYGDGSGLTGISDRTYKTMPLPTTVNDYQEIGNLDISGGAHSLYLAITVADTGFSVSKQYMLPLYYDMTSNLWRDAIPMANTGPYGGNDFALEVRVTGGTAYLRLRRTSGTLAGTALVSMEQIGSSLDAFTPSGGYGTSAANTYLSVTGLTQTSGNVGIGTTNPGTKLEVAGNVNLSGTMRTLTLGGNQGLKDGGAGDLDLFTQAGGIAPLIFKPADTEFARMTTDLKLGVGTAAPFYRLHISSGAGESGTIMAVSTGPTNLFWVAGDGAHALKYYGDGSSLTGISDNLGNHTATQNLNLAGYDIFGVSKMTVSSITTTGAAVTFSTNVYIVGIASAAKFYGDGSALTGTGDNLGNHTAAAALNMTGHDIFAVSTMTVSTITTTAAQITFSTNIYIVGIASATKYYGDGSALTGIIGTDGLGNHIATQNLNMTGHDIMAVSTMTVSSITTTAAAVTFSTNVYIVGVATAAKFYGDGSSLAGVIGTDSFGNHAAAHNLNMTGHDIFAVSTMTVSTITTTAAQITFSTNVYVVGIASAAKFYGDGSALTGIIGTDNLGNHTATMNLNMSGHDIFAVSTMTVSSITTTGAHITFSTNVYIVGIASAAKFYGDGSGLTGIIGTDNLGNHIATLNLNMTGHDIFGVSTITVSTITTTAAHITFSTNVYIVGIASAAKFYGDGSGLTGIIGTDGLGNHTATMNLNMTGHDIFAVSTMTVSSITTTGAAVTFSTNVYIVGIASATKFYGDGSGLTGLIATDGLGNQTATQNLNMTGHDIFAVSTMTVSSITTTGAAVTFSTNVYIVGIASAAKFYGDGSGLSNLPGSDNLGDHIATKDLNMAGHDIFAVSTMTVSTITSAGAGVTFSTSVFVGGNVGIGTVYTGARLDVQDGNAADRYLLRVGTGAASYQLAVSTAGRVGIGTSTAMARVDIEASATEDAYSLLVGTGAASYQLAVSTGGNVGIGVASPTSKLSLGGQSQLEFDTSAAGVVRIKVNGVTVAEMLPN